MDFEWDDPKAAANAEKHGVTFEEAQTAFDDPLFLAFVDPDHSMDERRFILLAESNLGRLLVVSYTERAESLRIISAREATKKERKAYEEDL
ncbi:MAG: BrnT family toxin [Fimbriimonadaceae bacterium]